MEPDGNGSNNTVFEVLLQMKRPPVTETVALEEPVESVIIFALLVLPARMNLPAEMLRLALFVLLTAKMELLFAVTVGVPEIEIKKELIKRNEVKLTPFQKIAMQFEMLDS